MKSIVYQERMRLDVGARHVNVRRAKREADSYQIVARWSAVEGLTACREDLQLTTRQTQWLADECARAYAEANL
jgi:hypothetical protein